MDEYRQWVDNAARKMIEKMEWCIEKNKGKIPYTTDSAGNYIDRADDNDCNSLSWWTNGFWGGILWLMYVNTKEEKYRQAAQETEERLSKCFDFFYGLNHDVGFMFIPTSVTNYRLTGSGESRKRGLCAANLLVGRFNPAGGFIRAWDGAGDGVDTRGWAIIDCMCNLSLLYWASEETGDPRFRQIAMLHADTAMKYFIREDGSVKHIVEFDPDTGVYRCSHGGQGYSHGSAWSRGQGWAVYGFVISYLHTKKPEYLDAAKRVADYCIAHIPQNRIIPCDFCQPAEPAWEDSCAAAILGSGILELANSLPDSGEQEYYRQFAWNLLETLFEKRADWTHNCDAILQNCTGAYHDNSHHFPMNYADFYFMEAVFKLRGTNFLMW